MKYKSIIISLIVLLSSCKNNRVQGLKLLESDVYNTSINDIRVANIRKKVFIHGKEGLRDALIKQAYRHIFSPIAISKGFEKNSEVRDAIVVRQNKILAKKVTQGIKILDVSDKEIRRYFDENLKKYTDNILYDLSFFSLKCKNKNNCTNILDTMMISQSFQELSIKYKQENVRNGHYENIDIAFFNDSFQKLIKSQTIGKISTPIKYDDSNFIFILVSNISSPTPPKLDKFKNSIKARLSKQKQKIELEKLKRLIVTENPDLINNSENSILSHYARKTNLTSIPDTKMLVARAKKWVLADYGYYSSFVFADIDTDKIKDIAIFNPNILKRLTRFTIEVTSSKQKKIKHKVILPKDEINSENLKMVTQSEFTHHYPFLKVDLFNIALNEHLPPIEQDDKLYWVYKSYQGLSTDNNQLIMDYKKHMRFMMGSYSSFMSQIGDKINLKINPIIYSDDWSKNAKLYYESLQNNK